jgi:hypothetical protein
VKIGQKDVQSRDYAGLDISMKETRQCLEIAKGGFLRLVRSFFMPLLGLLNQVYPSKRHKKRTKNPSKIHCFAISKHYLELFIGTGSRDRQKPAP